MSTSYKVRIWAITPRKNRAGKVTSYSVRWAVEKKEFWETFKVFTQADSYRSDLIAAQRRGEAFDMVTGFPVSFNRAKESVSWIELTFKYVDMKWPDLAATARQTLAEALIRVVPVFVPKGKATPDAKKVRVALRQWGYNTPKRNTDEVPEDARKVLDWLTRNSLPVTAVVEPDTLRELQRVVTRRLDGQAYAPTVARKTRSVLSNLLDYAEEELGLIDKNPMADVKWTAMPKGKRKIDKRAVPNPIQARSFLEVVRTTPRSGPRLVAYFGTMYYSGLRPEEVTALHKRHLSLPTPTFNNVTNEWEYGWGEFHLDSSQPYVDGRWTDDGTAGDSRQQLKSRPVGEIRPVPCPPQLTKLIWDHVAKFGYGEDGRLFVSEQGGPISKVTYTKVFSAARRVALTEEVQVTPLLGRPYDLRHAAVSTWLSGGVEPSTVAEWAGQSLGVLMEIYAASLYGAGVAARRQIETALGTAR